MGKNDLFILREKLGVFPLISIFNIYKKPVVQLMSIVRVISCLLSCFFLPELQSEDRGCHMLCRLQSPLRQFCDFGL